MRFNLWEFVLHIIGVHCLDLLAGWSSKHFDYLHQLINTTLSRE